jgi:arylsulfatase
VTAPAGAPNVLLVMTDDVGFGAAGAFGGPIPTPNLDRLAARGLIYTHFHTTAMCSPSRAALLTGRNHHAVGNGTVANLTTGYPGYWSVIPRSAATIAEVLKDNGYNTAMFGKHHNTPEADVSPAGPFDLWPQGLGFEYFYGFLAAQTNQFTPALYRDNIPVPTLHDEVLDKALADDLIGYVHNQQAAAPDKPFFIYWAPGTAHAPNQAPEDWIAKFRGRFDEGWDAMRAATVSRQMARGVVPAGTEASPRPDGIKAWAALTPDERRTSARMMEVYAAQLAYFDHQFGRVLDELDRMGLTDNTMVIFIEGDNGAAAEAGPDGSLNPMAVFANGMKETEADRFAALPDMGGPRAMEGYGFGWAWATDAPFPLFKEYASHLGGTRNGMVISWPERIKARGLRTQFAHLTDIMPTILEAAHIEVPSVVNGAAQQKLDGEALEYSFDAPAAAERHRTQYFEMLGNRAIYHAGWMASTTPTRLPWREGEAALPEHWELYDLDHDFAQSHDVAAEHPAKLKAMEALFDQEAKANNVYPLDNRLNLARFAAASAARKPRDHYVYWGAGVSVPSAAAAPMLDRAFIVTADLELPDKPASGAILSLGGHFGGWSLHLEDGRPVAFMAASQLAGDQSRVAAVEALKPGKVKLTFAFSYDGGMNAGGELRLYADGKLVGDGHIARTISKLPELIDTLDIGFDRATPVVDGVGSAPFSGAIDKVDIRLAPLGRPMRATDIGFAPALKGTP